MNTHWMVHLRHKDHNKNIVYIVKPRILFNILDTFGYGEVCRLWEVFCGTRLDDWVIVSKSICSLYQSSICSYQTNIRYLLCIVLQKFRFFFLKPIIQAEKDNFDDQVTVIGIFLMVFTRKHHILSGGIGFIWGCLAKTAWPIELKTL